MGTSSLGIWAFPKLFHGNAGVGAVLEPLWVTPGLDPPSPGGCFGIHIPPSSGSALRKRKKGNFGVGAAVSGLGEQSRASSSCTTPSRSRRELFPAEPSSGRSPGPGALSHPRQRLLPGLVREPRLQPALPWHGELREERARGDTAVTPGTACGQSHHWVRECRWGWGWVPLERPRTAGKGMEAELIKRWLLMTPRAAQGCPWSSGIWVSPPLWPRPSSFFGSWGCSFLPESPRVGFPFPGFCVGAVLCVSDTSWARSQGDF